MQMSFRWYGESDPVRLDYIRQIPGLHDYDRALGAVHLNGLGEAIDKYART